MSPACHTSFSLDFGDMAGVVRLDAVERERLADLLDELGPDAPTLLGSWTTRDLAAHLVLRERDLLAAPGLVVPGAWARFAERRRITLSHNDFSSLVASIRSGPPRGFFRIGWVRNLASLNEFFVHHEDVRRAIGLGPRANSPEMDAALWRNVRRSARFLARRVRRLGLELEWVGTGARVTVNGGAFAVHIAGPPGELLLYLFGRQGAAQVDISGAAEAVEMLRGARLGM